MSNMYESRTLKGFAKRIDDAAKDLNAEESKHLVNYASAKVEAGANHLEHKPSNDLERRFESEIFSIQYGNTRSVGDALFHNGRSIDAAGYSNSIDAWRQHLANNTYTRGAVSGLEGRGNRAAHSQDEIDSMMQSPSADTATLKSIRRNMSGRYKNTEIYADRLHAERERIANEAESDFKADIANLDAEREAHAADMRAGSIQAKAEARHNRTDEEIADTKQRWKQDRESLSDRKKTREWNKREQQLDADTDPYSLEKLKLRQYAEGPLVEDDAFNETAEIRKKLDWIRANNANGRAVGAAEAEKAGGATRAAESDVERASEKVPSAFEKFKSEVKTGKASKGWFGGPKTAEAKVANAKANYKSVMEGAKGMTGEKLEKYLAEQGERLGTKFEGSNWAERERSYYDNLSRDPSFGDYMTGNQVYGKAAGVGVAALTASAVMGDGRRSNAQLYSSPF